MSFITLIRYSQDHTPTRRYLMVSLYIYILILSTLTQYQSLLIPHCRQTYRSWVKSLNTNFVSFFCLFDEKKKCDLALKNPGKRRCGLICTRRISQSPSLNLRVSSQEAPPITLVAAWTAARRLFGARMEIPFCGS